ncbi:hypothetical protein SAMN04487906_0671 [Zhouia amylolytica]|uniref:Uncharacterized protein n=1 Tax=Zhouia amylolytica TaxID=376730 RepID=A0A1I6QI38_9FLAO|nr:hypothetical protein SAMN04487906_0671 [Zhouia amylolytica]
MSGRSNAISKTVQKKKNRTPLGKLSRLEQYGSLLTKKQESQKLNRKELLIQNLKLNQKKKKQQHKRNILIIMVLIGLTILILSIFLLFK